MKLEFCIKRKLDYFSHLVTLESLINKIYNSIKCTNNFLKIPF